jgi:hypothetical protein
MNVGSPAGFETGQHVRTRQGAVLFTLWRPLPGSARNHRVIMSADSVAGDTLASNASEVRQLPSTLAEFVQWLAQCRGELWPRRERSIGTSGIITLPLGKSRDDPGPSTADVNLHLPSAEYGVMVKFLDLVDLLCPTPIALEFHSKWPRARLGIVRDLILAMRWIEEMLLKELAMVPTGTGELRKPNVVRELALDLSPVQDAVYRALTGEFQSADDIARAAHCDPLQARRELPNLKRMRLVDHKSRVGYRRAPV